MRMNHIVLVAGLLLWSGVAQAHGQLVPGQGLLSLVLHPLLGLDHLLVMFAVGLWSARQRSLPVAALLPLVFVAAIPAGSLLIGVTPLQIIVEPLVIASVLLFGVILFLNRAVPLPLLLPVVAGTGALHGLAHITGVGSNIALSLIAMMAGSVLLQMAGVAVGRYCCRVAGQGVYRVTGSVLLIAATGLALSGG